MLQRAKLMSTSTIQKERWRLGTSPAIPLFKSGCAGGGENNGRGNGKGSRKVAEEGAQTCCSTPLPSLPRALPPHCGEAGHLSSKETEPAGNEELAAQAALRPGSLTTHGPSMRPYPLHTVPTVPNLPSCSPPPSPGRGIPS